MQRKKMRVTAAGGIHMAVAAALGEAAKAEGVHVFLRAGKKMVSVRKIPAILALGVHEQEQVEIIVDGREEDTENSVMEQIERILGDQ